MEQLTGRQQQVLDVIRRHIDATGYPPTRADIAAELGFRSANAAEEHLKALARKGAVEMIPGTSRGIRLVERRGLPIVGRVAAGEPILAEQHIEDHCEVAPSFFHPEAHYLLRVRGDSMVDAGILDGDLLAVHRTDQARDGEIIVARIDNEVTVKRLQRSRARHQLELIAANPAYAPIEVDLRHQEFTIEGLAVGVLRRSV